MILYTSVLESYIYQIIESSTIYENSLVLYLSNSGF